MGRFVNPNNSAFQVALNSQIYVDKTGMIAYTNRVLGTMEGYICNSRPRRFGKSITANMLTAYYSKGCDSEAMFAGLEISKSADFKKHLNKYDVIHIDIQWCIEPAGSVENVVSFISEKTISELDTYYPNILAEKTISLPDALSQINTAVGKKFIIIIDEWDVLIRDESANAKVQKDYIKAIPHKERTAKRSGKRYNKEVKKQLTMSLISDELGQASTKKKEFLGIMEKLIPWSQWVGIVQPHYYKGERGNKPYDLELMLRIYVLQHLYNLADDAARNEIIDSRAFSQFCGVDSSNQVPDGDTIGRFRHILERNQLGEAFFTNVVESLQKCNLMLKKGTIVDSTLIAAPSSTKNKEKQRDPEAHSVKKGNQWYFGYKEHIGVDADSGLVHTVETTSANVHDSNMVAELLQGTEEEIYGDSGYLGAEKRDDAVLVNNEGKPIRYQINKRPSQLKKANGEKFELLKAIEHAKSSVRSKVEHVFCVIKRIFHFCKTRYRGRKKLHQHCCTLFALANLYLARNRMKVA